MITAVTTCMGRLDHLETTLPLMLQEFERVIVVDWSCPQKSGDWAEMEGAKVVRQVSQKYWNASKARNLGARHVDSRSVCFLDADTMVVPGLRKEIEEQLNLSTMVVASRNHNNIDVPNLNGFIAVDIGHFWGVNGYNESLEGYAIEDGYLRAQLCLERDLKVARATRLAAIRHSDELRARHQKESIHVTAKRNYAILQDYLRSKGVTDWQSDPRTAEMAYR